MIRFAVLLAGCVALCCPLRADHPAAVLIENGTTAMRSNPETTKREADAALELLRRRPDADLEIRARLLLCDYYSERDRAQAEQHSAAAAGLLGNARRAGLRAGVLNCQGAIHETVGDNDQALTLYQEAVAVASGAKDDEMLAHALFSRGYLLGLRADYGAGLADLKRAQDLFEQLDKQAHALTVLNSIAILYNRMGDYVQAREIYERALKLQRDAGLRREVAVTQHNLGRAYENLQHWDQAQEAFNASLAISRELKYARGEAYALRGLATVFNAKDDPQAALDTLERAAVVQKTTPDARLNAQIQMTRGIALQKLRRFSQSIVALEQALAVFMHAGSLNERSATYTALADAYAELGNWEKAYAYRTQAQRNAEQLLRNQLDQRFSALKVEFDTAAKEKENILLKRENEASQEALAQQQRARRLQTIVIALTGVLGTLLATLAWHQRRGKQRMRVLAMTDELTNMPNRRAVLARIALLLHSAKTSSCALLIVDIDHFKSINDRYGHPVGDEILKLVAAKLREAVHEPAFVGRLGGEEFMMVLPQTALEDAERFADTFREAVRSLDVTPWLGERRITVSIGVTVSIPGVDTPSTLLRRADDALYAAKNAGRDCVRIAPDPMAEISSVQQFDLLVANSNNA